MFMLSKASRLLLDPVNNSPQKLKTPQKVVLAVLWPLNTLIWFILQSHPEQFMNV